MMFIKDILSIFLYKIYLDYINFLVFSYEYKCSPENSEKPSLAFRFISVITKSNLFNDKFF